MNIKNTIKEIQSFLEGKNDELKYIVNVETDPSESFARCVIHEPGKPKRIDKIPFTPFLYIKDLKKEGINLFYGNKDKEEAIKIKYGITITNVKTGKHPRMKNGFPYKVTSSKNYASIINFFKEAGYDPFEKQRDEKGNLIRDGRGYAISKWKHLYYMPKLTDQFFISTGARLYKGIDEYKDLHRLIYDIETTGLRFEHSRIFAIGIKDNRGLNIKIEVEKPDDDQAELKLIKNFFEIVNKVKPAVIAGYNSEDFDYEFMLGRCEILEGKNCIKKFDTTLHPDKHLYKRNSTVKYGNKADKYRATIAWGYSIIDIMHAAKKTAAVNTDIKSTGLKYICKYEDIAKKNRMYINGKDGDIYKFWINNPMFIINPDNNKYTEIPNEYKTIAQYCFKIQQVKDKIDEKKRRNILKGIYNENPDFVKWLKENSSILFDSDTDDNQKKVYKFINGKNILSQYLLDDLWETEQIDNLYNQSSFLLAKIIPTTYARICTMGTAAVWNLIMTAWSYENDLAIPEPDKKEHFSGGLARCFKRGFTEKVIKIDYASLYPMIQLTWDVFPIFDITGVIKKLLSYLTTTRNIYKKLANDDQLSDVEIELLKTIDLETYDKLVRKTIDAKERNLYKVKQLPIKILNNSLFGALGSGYAFNWSDNICSGRITCSGRLYLRQAIHFFNQFGCDPLMAVTDGINFRIPDYTHIILNENGIDNSSKDEDLIENMWKYNSKTGISALIEYFNKNNLPGPYMSVDNDGEFDSCYNLSRINYALMSDKIDKKTKEPIYVIDENGEKIKKKKVKLTGNTIKSSTMPEYIEEFYDKGIELILKGKGVEFVDYYNDYAERIFYGQIPLKKIASKSNVKMTINDYINRGTDKNGKQKARQAHMELIIKEREEIAKKIFEEKFDELKDNDDKNIEDYDILTIQEKVETYMPPEPELDSTVYYVNIGTRKSHGDVKTDPKTKEVVFNVILINKDQMEENPDTIGEYNVDKYLAAFNNKVKVLLEGFDVEVRNKLLAKISRKKIKDANGDKIEQKSLITGNFKASELVLNNFNHDEFNESLSLEAEEINFWNKTGYNPRLVWEDFKILNDDKHGKLHLKIYEDAVKYVSDQMVAAGKKPVLSVNDKSTKGDYVLYKNNKEYSLGYNNGDFIEIVRESISIPKSDYEKELEEKIRRKLDEEENKIQELKRKNVKLQDTASQVKLSKYWKEFCEKFGLPKDTDKEKLFKEKEGSENFFKEFVKSNIEEEEYEEVPEDADFFEE